MKDDESKLSKARKDLNINKGDFLNVFTSGSFF